MGLTTHSNLPLFIHLLLVEYVVALQVPVLLVEQVLQGEPLEQVSAVRDRVIALTPVHVPVVVAELAGDHGHGAEGGVLASAAMHPSVLLVET